MTPHFAELPAWADVLISALLVAGACFALVGSWGLARLSDFYKRVHGPTKTVTLGVGCVLIASGLWFALRGSFSMHELLIALFLFITAPVAAQMMVKAALALDPSARPPRPPAADDHAPGDRG
ncbi:MAG TPA: Na+/H+ antiporter subunit G [Burkholderiaceae bacterium]|nr:Na+/H+ antiporter subunit G [Burkholderiaceae bacterium]